MANPNRVPKTILQARGSPLASSRHDCPTIDGKPDPPEWMPEDARPYWDEVLSLVHPHVLAKQDAHHVAQLAMDMLECVRAMGHLAIEGEVLESHTGSKYPNPWMGIKNRALARIEKARAKLGMNPSDRSNVEATPEAAKGRIGKYLGIA